MERPLAQLDSVATRIYPDRYALLRRAEGHADEAALLSVWADTRSTAAGAQRCRGALEAMLFRVSRSGKAPDYYQALEWLQAVVDEGRSELETQRAFERELEAWEMSCRIAFMIRLADWHASMPRQGGW
jgi:hypothetical protein